MSRSIFSRSRSADPCTPRFDAPRPSPGDAPRACAAGGDPWGQQVLLTLGLAAATWVKSVLRPHGGTSDVGIFDQMWTVLPIVYARALCRGARRRLASA